MHPHLPEAEFFALIESAPLVSIDLVVRNGEGACLVGKRRNRPAQHTWFAPGGRIHKGQTIKDAFIAVGLAELGQTLLFENAKLLGAYDHIYPDSVSTKPGVGTQYVVLAYEMSVADLEIAELPLRQHSEWKWLPVSDLLGDPEVHVNTKNYFKPSA